MKYHENLLGGLNAILYFLFYMYDVNDEEAYQKLETHIRKTYNPDKIEHFKQAVEWALENPDFVFEKQLSGLNKSHEEICVYF